jgi:sulfane dehydrogenase subunit SoxC
MSPNGIASKDQKTPDRREFLIVAATLGATVAAPDTARPQEPPKQADKIASAALPPPPSAKSSANCAPTRSQSRNQANFAKNTSRLVDLNATNQGGQYWRYSTLITPVEDFFIRNEYATPTAETDERLDRRSWRLKIHGDAVSRPMLLTYDDLMKLPSRSIVSNMECAGNGRSLFWEQQNMTAGARNKVLGTGWGLGGVGCAEWQYVPMNTILDLVGLKKNAKQCLFWSGVDGKTPGAASDTGRPIPISMLQRHGDVIGLAFKMNGNDLTADHGAPVRAIVPGWCGAASTKWLTEIKIATHNFWVRLNSSAHVMIGPNYMPPVGTLEDEYRGVSPGGVLGQAVTWSPPRSLLTVPLVLEKQPKLPGNYPLAAGELPRLNPGRQVMRGYAWATQYGVKRVDVRINKGPWEPVRLIDPQINIYTWRRFEFDWSPLAGEHLIETRVTDRSGAEQPATVPFNEGGFDFWAIPKFRVKVAAAA